MPIQSSRLRALLLYLDTKLKEDTEEGVLTELEYENLREQLFEEYKGDSIILTQALQQADESMTDDIFEVAQILKGQVI